MDALDASEVNNTDPIDLMFWQGLLPPAVLTKLKAAQVEIDKTDAPFSIIAACLLAAATIDIAAVGICNQMRRAARKHALSVAPTRAVKALHRRKGRQQRQRRPMAPATEPVECRGQLCGDKQSAWGRAPTILPETGHHDVCKDCIAATAANEAVHNATRVMGIRIFALAYARL